MNLSALPIVARQFIAHISAVYVPCELVLQPVEPPPPGLIKRMASISVACTSQIHSTHTDTPGELEAPCCGAVFSSALPLDHAAQPPVDGCRSNHAHSARQADFLLRTTRREKQRPEAERDIASVECSHLLALDLTLTDLSLALGFLRLRFDWRGQQ